MLESTSRSADEALLRDALGGTIAPTARIERISREPLGGGSVTGFTVADGDSEPVTVFVDTSGQSVRAETGAVLPDDAGGVAARIWLHPADPHLPALAPAAFGHAATGLLARAGVEAAGAPRIVGYRPGRRAVLRAPTTAEPSWIKVVRPRRAAQIVERHALLRSAGLPVPLVRAWSPEGLLILDDAGGTPAIETEASADLLLDAVDLLRARLGAVPFDDDARAGIVGRIDWYSSRLGSSIATAIAAALHDAVRAEAPRPRVGIHGDLHLGQLFVPDASSAEIIGLIDVDTAGLGDPAEDPAAFLSHLLASTLLSSGMSGRDRLCTIAERATERWAGDVHVRTRTAIQLLGHAVAADDRADPARREGLLALAAWFAAPVGDPGSLPKTLLTPDFGTP